ncbi:hypothetical protein HMPREF3097_04295 [Corynebacterium sp. HMSC27B11]|nr:hypothetical protein HMPREF3097_04295 [Corynebacterium sp. HMSC27B11]
MAATTSAASAISQNSGRSRYSAATNRRLRSGLPSTQASASAERNPIANQAANAGGIVCGFTRPGSSSPVKGGRKAQ